MTALVPITIDVPFKWRLIVASECANWPFSKGGNTPLHLGDDYSGPRIYRFFFEPGDGGAACYIGEAEEFRGRLGDYIQAVRRARQETSESWAELNEKLKSDSKIRKKLLATQTGEIPGRILCAEAAKSRVRLELLDFNDFYFNRILISADELGDLFIRRAIENLAILHTRCPQIEIINRGTDSRSKFFTRLITENAKDLNAARR